MARRPAPEEFDQPLSEEELARLRHSLSLLSPSSVEKEYQRAYEACKLQVDILPRAANIQKLVASWKLLWKWRRTRRQPERG